MRKLLLETRQLHPHSADGFFLSPPLDLRILSGDIVFINGDNGSGKSTLLKTVLGLHKFYQGSFSLYISQKDIQYLPQLGNLSFHLPLTLDDILEDADRDHLLLRGLDLSKKWNTASGGERQKVLLAAILAHRPRLLILDEPFNHVDKDAGVALESALTEYFKRNPDSALLIVSHRPVSAFLNSSRQVELK